ncbi:hypothetical protein Baya_1535 [Bagarius yarrelli]|uniref:Uncharacterized protein n=1 Tax=Bagarius yarrelli TaxID=175774 RepID=A0A556TLD7_BAGYA|nr:hypothetical protein Baya_1535 [Bagarius yarrelli]
MSVRGYNHCNHAAGDKELEMSSSSTNSWSPELGDVLPPIVLIPLHLPSVLPEPDYPAMMGSVNKTNMRPDTLQVTVA